MTRTVEGYTDVDKNVVHLFTECPEGSRIGYKVPVSSISGSKRENLQTCVWCEDKDRKDDRTGREQAR
jgi:hypothetical protein